MACAGLRWQDADVDAGLSWRGDMRHLPSVGRTAQAPTWLVKHDDDGATFVISETTLPWAHAQAPVPVPTFVPRPACQGRSRARR
jgi:hypothetical protein